MKVMHLFRFLKLLLFSSLEVVLGNKTLKKMVSANVSGDLSSEMEVDAFRRLFPLRYHERFLLDSIRPDARPLGRARDTSLALGQLKLALAKENMHFSTSHFLLKLNAFHNPCHIGAVASADGSALAKIGCTVSAFQRSLSLSFTHTHTHTHKACMHAQHNLSHIHMHCTIEFYVWWINDSKTFMFKPCTDHVGCC